MTYYRLDWIRQVNETPTTLEDENVDRYIAFLYTGKLFNKRLIEMPCYPADAYFYLSTFQLVHIGLIITGVDSLKKL